MKTLAVLGALCALLVAGTPAASAKKKTLAQRVAALEKSNRNKTGQIKALQQRLADDENVLAAAAGILGCLGIVPADLAPLDPDSLTGAFVFNDTPTPLVWLVSAADECVDTSGASARSHGIRRFGFR